jgi:hypothetical protein
MNNHHWPAGVCWRKYKCLTRPIRIQNKRWNFRTVNIPDLEESRFERNQKEDRSQKTVLEREKKEINPARRRE